MASARREKTDGKKHREPIKVGRAVLGCFLRSKNSDGRIYAVVCRHVTKTAERSFFLGHPQPDTEIARKKFTKCETKCGTESLKQDVDLIEFNESKQAFVQPIYRNMLGEKREFRLYQGSVADLHGVEVFQCYREKKENISKSGIVLATPDLPESLRQLICLESNFIVDDVNGEPFANEGDSGRVVAREAEDGCIELVGIITWGQFQCRVDPENSGNYSVCLLLRSALEHLNQRYELDLGLYNTPADKCDDENVIEPGQIVAFKIGL